jgi:hypothetical protein
MEPSPIVTEPPITAAPDELSPLFRLKQLFVTLPDPRVAGRVRHALPEVLLVALCAMICDCDSFTGMGHFTRTQLAWLRQFISLRNGAPSHHVFRNVFKVSIPVNANVAASTSTSGPQSSNLFSTILVHKP